MYIYIYTHTHLMYIWCSVALLPPPCFVVWVVGLFTWVV